jgi:hypothetical protein
MERRQGRNEEAVDQKLHPLSRKRHVWSENHHNAEQGKETEVQRNRYVLDVNVTNT